MKEVKSVRHAVVFSRRGEVAGQFLDGTGCQRVDREGVTTYFSDLICNLVEPSIGWSVFTQTRGLEVT